MGVTTVRVENLHVRYRVYDDKRRSLREVVTRPLAARRHRDVHAVKGVTFSAHAGEVIGVIGPNGSGKSTLMRAISGLEPIADGTVYVRSTPMLLGVGAVLNKTLSGRRNILLGGLALGLTREEVLAKEQDIIDFAGIGSAIDLPMRTYSSGMAARLQFSISAAAEPEILIIDEALAVGDQAFRAKSDRRIRELRQAAGTVFIVSHNMKSILRTCTRVLWLEDGELRRDGDPREIVPEYRAPMRERRKRRKQRRKARREARRLARAAEQREQSAAVGAPATTDAP